MTEPLRLTLESGDSVSALLDLPEAAPLAGYVFAHGAGAGMAHAFMAAVATGLATRGIATLRYQFPYMEKRSKRPDVPAVAHAAVRAAVAEALRRRPDLPWFAGGKSFGSRMTSQAQAAAPLPGLRGLVFFGFPLHPAGKLSRQRAEHLADLRCPLLFLQGTRDELADEALMREVIAGLGAIATAHWIEGADHAFHVKASSGRNDQQVLAELLDGAAAWMAATARR